MQRYRLQKWGLHVLGIELSALDTTGFLSMWSSLRLAKLPGRTVTTRQMPAKAKCD
jgi:hypothetical protein